MAAQNRANPSRGRPEGGPRGSHCAAPWPMPRATLRRTPGVALRRTLIRGLLCMVGTRGQGLRPGLGAPRAAQGALGTVELCCHFNGNTRPRPALEGPSWPREPKVYHIDLSVLLSSQGSRQKARRSHEKVGRQSKTKR